MVIVGLLILTSATVRAHVPYIERQDYSADNPFKVRASIENSIAVYAWFETAADVDVYTFEVTRPVRLYANALVPVCPGYEMLLPWLAVLGPGLPAPAQEVPFNIPPGYGAIVVENLAPGEPRETFYEPFGGKSYYDSPAFDQEVSPSEGSQSKTWYIYSWSPAGLTGDYVAVLGQREFFALRDIIRALALTPMIRHDGELHVECPREKSLLAPTLENGRLATSWGQLKKALIEEKNPLK